MGPPCADDLRFRGAHPDFKSCLKGQRLRMTWARVVQTRKNSAHLTEGRRRSDLVLTGGPGAL